MQKPGEGLTTHEYWMREALAQARQSVGVASPNPAVGCVLVRDGKVVGKGFHAYDWLDHAEVAALKEARGEARGATAYITLEPCCHTGRTGPCTQALISAGVEQVVIATRDPNPLVSGKGIEQLHRASIRTAVGVLQREARELNDGFARHIRTALPFVTLKAGVSLDGRIAPAPGSVPRGEPVYLTGEEARAAVQQMRHCSDAVMTGINTVLQDDPLLTDRSGLTRRRLLLRVILDSGLRIPLDAKLVRTAHDDVMIFCSVAPTDRQRALEAMGIRVERVDPDVMKPNGPARRIGDPVRRMGVSLSQVLKRLGELGVLSVLLEGGAQMNSSVLKGGHADKLTLFYAPTFLGPAAVPLLQEGIPSPVPEGLAHTVSYVGQDIRVDAYLRDPWA
jgi:diaminohydroxyphosphoribosylaminopyrimidine deaminase/5-amino-6-(5-phosphoribosylamino)uracil reductase